MLLAAALLVPSSAWAITIDGQVNDWGLTPAAFGASDWTPNSGIYYTEEDQNPAVYYLNPGYGGQAFDAEGLYFTRDDNFAYFAIVAGFPLEGRFYQGQQYYAGDVAFDFGRDGSYEFGLETTGTNQETLFGDPTWINPLFVSCGPYALAAGTAIGNALFAYDNTTYVGTGHYVFEFGIPISFFGTSWSSSDYIPDLTVRWTMSCGNDCIALSLDRVPHSPEPSTFVMLLLGMIGLSARAFFGKRTV